MSQGILEPVKKGLYIAGQAVSSNKPEPFLLANHILGPSYVSMDTPLSFHGWIPEGSMPQNGLEQKANILIKPEVDREPPLGFSTEERLLLKPFSFYVKCFTLPDLFAGKMHALLFHKWGTNVEGRDWYDMEWYIKKGTPLNLNHFLLRAQNSNDWKKSTITGKEFRDLLTQRIDAVDIGRVKADIRRFIPDQKILEIWSAGYFHDLVALLNTYSLSYTSPAIAPSAS